jgi:hypothetical protein
MINIMTKRRSKSSRAGLQFSAARVGRFVKTLRLTPLLGDHAPVYLAAVLEVTNKLQVVYQ